MDYKGTHYQPGGDETANPTWELMPWVVLGVAIGLLLVLVPFVDALAVASGAALIIVMSRRPEYAILAIVVL